MKNNKEKMTVEKWNSMTFDEMMDWIREDPDWDLSVKWLRWYGKELGRRKRLAKMHTPEIYEKDFDREFAQALFYEVYPPHSELRRRMYKSILARAEKRERGVTIWTKWGNCEICGYEGVVKEYGLSWVCDDPFCNHRMKVLYQESLDEFREENNF